MLFMICPVTIKDLNPFSFFLQSYNLINELSFFNSSLSEIICYYFIFNLFSFLLNTFQFHNFPNFPTEGDWQKQLFKSVEDRLEHFIVFSLYIASELALYKSGTVVDERHHAILYLLSFFYLFKWLTFHTTR